MKRLVSFVSRTLRKINWRKVGRVALAVLPLVLVGSEAAFVSGVGISKVGYGTGGALGTKINDELENVAATVRDILGGTALLALVVAALVNHFIHDPRSKDRAKEIVVAAIVGLLIAAFAPQIVNWIASL
ncbi:MAG: hypothetical protein M0Z94_14300 [Dehalococcoidales bacterium]|nr:hypothetical protein [Dehalococcoidales bacterium]